MNLDSATPWSSLFKIFYHNFLNFFFQNIKKSSFNFFEKLWYNISLFFTFQTQIPFSLFVLVKFLRVFFYCDYFATLSRYLIIFGRKQVELSIQFKMCFHFRTNTIRSASFVVGLRHELIIHYINL